MVERAIELVENLGKIIGSGFETYTKNLNLGAPFVLNVVVSGLLAMIVLGIGLFSIFDTELSTLERALPEQVLPSLITLISQHLSEIIVLFVVYFLISLFFQSFFTAGAIGMARQATETGKSYFAVMMESGKKNVVNLYLAEILVGLLFLAGIVFLVPGALNTDFSQLFTSPDPGAVLLLVGGMFIWVLYILVLSIVLAIYRYALVVENLGPMEGVLEGIRFFKGHKSDVFSLWVIQIAILIALAIVGQIMGHIPVVNLIWPFLSILISVLVLAPLTTVWWVRLFMTGTGKKLYVDELLAHPNELEQFKANQ